MHTVEAKGILSAQNVMNLYRGCTHGCIYCDSRSLCYRMAHAFEDVEVKRNAPELLERALRGKREKCMISTGAMSDPYIPLERAERLTRACLEIIERRGFGLAIQTKSADILRDADLLASIHRRAKCVAQMTLTTFDEALCRVLEPRVSTTRERFEALCTLRKRGIPTVVWLSPILPFLNDTEENLRGLIDLCAEAGVRGILYFGAGLTLREGNREYFYQQLDRHFPGLSAVYQQKYANAYQVQSGHAQRLDRLVEDACARRGIALGNDRLFAWLRAPINHTSIQQISFFD